MGAHQASPELHPAWADLHIHTVLSPCAEIEMLPPLIIQRARDLGLGALAITDHNSAENVAAVQQAARGSGICILAGMEVQTREEVHLLCLFDTVEQVWAWQEVVYAHLPDLPNRDDVFGSQLVVDEEGEFVRFNQRLLLVAADLSVEDVVAGVKAIGGLVIAAHVDRQAFSLISNLGFIPEGLALAALELTRHTQPDEALRRMPQIAGWPLVTSGDAHRLSEMTANLLIHWRAPSIAELALALQSLDGRKVKRF